MTLSRFKATYGLYAIAFYGLFSSFRDIFYLEEIFSCTKGYNACYNLPYPEFMLSMPLIYTLFIIKIICFVTLFFKPLIKPSLILHLVIQAYFFYINRYFYTPEMGYLHFMFFAMLFSPLDKNNFLKPSVFKPFEIIVYLSYTFSGYYKLGTPYWMNGTFFYDFFRGNKMIHPWMDALSFNYNHTVYFALTFIVLFIELFAITALFNKYLKVFIWTGITLMHFSLLFIADLAEVSLGMLVVQLFLMDETVLEFYAAMKKRVFGFN